MGSFGRSAVFCSSFGSRVGDTGGAMSQPIFLQMKTWDKIRGNFSQEEKDSLNSAICGEAICPPGISVDAGKLKPELAEKLRKLKKELL
jgi:hypothetical protein